MSRLNFSELVFHVIANHVVDFDAEVIPADRDRIIYRFQDGPFKYEVIRRIARSKTGAIIATTFALFDITDPNDKDYLYRREREKLYRSLVHRGEQLAKKKAALAL